MQREVEVCIISDVHLGTYGCHATELLAYLKSIKPKTLVLNGDIVDMWQFNKSYFPQSHMKVIKHITGLIANHVHVIYITGNHDEMLRKFVGFKLGSFEIANKVVLNLNNKKTWIFHGDVFDVTMQHSKWLAKLGAHGYDFLILLNRFSNFVLEKLGREKISLSKRIKNSVKTAVKYINNFEQIAADIAITKGYDFVACGHIHQPVKKQVSNAEGEVTYLNSGDWIENLTALEYNFGEWSIFDYQQAAPQLVVPQQYVNEPILDSAALFQEMLSEFRMMEN